MNLRKSGKKRQTSSARSPKEIVCGPGECFGMDFVYDNLSAGRAIRILNVIDLWDRSCPVLTVGFPQTRQEVLKALGIFEEQGRLPRTLRADNSPEFTSNALKGWAEKKGIAIYHTRPGKPTDNGHIESFNGSLRKEYPQSSY